MTLVVCKIDGVPLILPSVVPHVSPVGRDGLISQDVMVPPLVDGRFGVMAVPFSSVIFSGEYVMSLGACSLTVIEMVAVDSPPELLAVMLYNAVADVAVGVPLITPLELKLSPAGREGDELQKALSPVLEGVMLVIGVPTVNVNGEPE